MARNGCVFCGGSPLTKEHVLPRWLRHHLDYAPQTATWTTRPDGSLNSALSIPVIPGERTVRMVCATCNNGWMSKLETRAEPALRHLIVGRPTLTHGQRQILASWSLKTAMMTQLIARQRFSKSEYEQYGSTQLIPPTTTIYAASARTSEVQVFESSVLLRSDSMERLPYHSTSLWLGRMVLRVEGGQGALLTDRARQARTLGMAQIFPRPDRRVQLPVVSMEQFARYSNIHRLVEGSSEAWRLVL